MEAGKRPISQIIRARRESLRLSQRRLAQLIGVSQPTLWRWEEGLFVPSKANILTIAIFLKLDGDALLAGEEKEAVAEQPDVYRVGGEALTREPGPSYGRIISENVEEIDVIVSPSEVTFTVYPLGIPVDAILQGLATSETTSVAAAEARRMDRVLKVVGDAMEPILRPGSLVGVQLLQERPELAIAPGDIVLVGLPGTTTLALLSLIDATKVSIHFPSTRRDAQGALIYPPLTFPLLDPAYSIAGRVVWSKTFF